MITRGVPGRTFIPYIVDLRIKTEASGSRVSDACFAALAIERGCEWDVGWAIRPGYVEGQIQGGVAQGIGWALNEEYIYDAKGRMDNPGFLDYRVPVASDMPMIEPILVEVPNPAHPLGRQGGRRGQHRAADGGDRQRDRQRHPPPPDRVTDVAAEDRRGTRGGSD